MIRRQRSVLKGCLAVAGDQSLLPLLLLLLRVRHGGRGVLRRRCAVRFWLEVLGEGSTGGEALVTDVPSSGKRRKSLGCSDGGCGCRARRSQKGVLAWWFCGQGG